MCKDNSFNDEQISVPFEGQKWCVLWYDSERALALGSFPRGQGTYTDNGCLLIYSLLHPFSLHSLVLFSAWSLLHYSSSLISQKHSWAATVGERHSSRGVLHDFDLKFKAIFLVISTWVWKNIKVQHHSLERWCSELLYENNPWRYGAMLLSPQKLIIFQLQHASKCFIPVILQQFSNTNTFLFIKEWYDNTKDI